MKYEIIKKKLKKILLSTVWYASDYFRFLFFQLLLVKESNSVLPDRENLGNVLLTSRSLTKYFYHLYLDGSFRFLMAF